MVRAAVSQDSGGKGLAEFGRMEKSQVQQACEVEQIGVSKGIAQFLVIVERALVVARIWSH